MYDYLVNHMMEDVVNQNQHFTIILLLSKIAAMLSMNK